jgi:hypothetical protein
MQTLYRVVLAEKRDGLNPSTAFGTKIRYAPRGEFGHLPARELLPIGYAVRSTVR